MRTPRPWPSPAIRFPAVRFPVAWLLAAPLLLAAACGGGEPPSGEDPEGEAAPPGDAGATPAAAEAAGGDSTQLLADLLMEWQGGREAWQDTRFLRFDWIVERGGETVARRSHAWDRWEGRYRLSYGQSDTSRVVALFDVRSLASDSLEAQGDVWAAGEKLEGAARDSALQQAYGAFVNDSYWLLMPLKWRDPGVHLAYEGWTELPDGQSYPTVHLTFDEGLGVTNDQYWGFLDPETGRMVAWRFHLQGQEQKGPVIWWREWSSYGPQGLRLAMDRRWQDGPLRIHFEDVAADTAVPTGVFTSPAE